MNNFPIQLPNLDAKVRIGMVLQAHTGACQNVEKIPDYKYDLPETHTSANLHT